MILIVPYGVLVQELRYLLLRSLLYGRVLAALVGIGTDAK